MRRIKFTFHQDHLTVWTFKPVSLCQSHGLHNQIFLLSCNRKVTHLKILFSSDPLNTSKVTLPMIFVWKRCKVVRTELVS